MMASTELLSDNVLEWLLEECDPGVRYLAMRDLLYYRPDSPELQNARTAAHKTGPIAAVLDEMVARR